MKIIAILLVLLVGINDSRAATPQEQEEVKNFLQNRQQSGAMPGDSQKLKHLGKTAFHLLVGYLPQTDFGRDAFQVMIELEADTAAPLIFQSIPQRSSTDVQFSAFEFYVRYVRGQKSFSDKNKILMYEAAIRRLKMETKSTIAEQALLAVGLTGSRRDFPLLIQCYRNKTTVDMGRFIIHDAAEASLARLGSKQHLDNITRQLKAPVPDKLTFKWAQDLSDSMQRAAFSNNHRFIPLLCRHLHTPTPETDSDVIPHSPPYEARDALNQLTYGTSHDSKRMSLEEWRRWCATSPK